MSFLSVALLLAWVAIVLMACVLASVVRQLATIVAPRRDAPTPVIGPAVGSKAPPLREENGHDGRARLLLFASSTCRACEELVPRLSDLAVRYEPDLAITAVYADGGNGLGAGPFHVALNEAESFNRFRVPAPPFGVLINGDGLIIAAEAIGSVDMLDEFVASALSHPEVR